MTNRHAVVLIAGVPTEMAATDTILGNVSGNAGTATTAGTVTTPAQSAITSIGTLTGLTTKLGTGSTTMTQNAMLYSSSTPADNTSTGETDLLAYTLLANTMVNSGQTMIHEINGIFANNANAKTLKTYFGGSVIRTDTLPTNIAGIFSARFVIKRTSASHQSYTARMTRTIAGGATVTTVSRGDLTETETADIAMKTTGQGGATSDISQYEADIISGLGN